MDILFTEHSIFRMKKRGITKEEVLIAIQYANKTLKIGDKFYAQKDIGRAVIEAVYEKDKYIKVVTVYYL